MLKNRLLLNVHAEGKKKEEKPKKTVEYIKPIKDIELEIAEGVKLVFSVSKKNEESDAHVDIRTWVENDNYVGPTKKGVNFNIEFLDTVIEALQDLSEKCDKKGI